MFFAHSFVDFFNVLNTLKEQYVSSLIEHANAQRNSAGAQNNEDQVIEVSDRWLEKLKAVPFISQRKGRTVHLLKKASKPVKERKPKRKISLIMTPKEYAAAQRASLAADVEMQTDQQEFKDITKDLIRK